MSVGNVILVTFRKIREKWRKKAAWESKKASGTENTCSHGINVCEGSIRPRKGGSSGQSQAERRAHGKSMPSLRQSCVTMPGLGLMPQVYPMRHGPAIGFWSGKWHDLRAGRTNWRRGGWKQRPLRKLLYPFQARDDTAVKTEEVQMGLRLRKTWWPTQGRCWWKGSNGWNHATIFWQS